MSENHRKDGAIRKFIVSIFETVCLGLVVVPTAFGLLAVVIEFFSGTPTSFKYAAVATLIVFIATVFLTGVALTLLDIAHNTREMVERLQRMEEDKSPSAEDRLPKLLHFAESDVIIGVVRAGSVHKVGYGHKWDWEA
jgi:hypothetical protein